MNKINKKFWLFILRFGLVLSGVIVISGVIMAAPPDSVGDFVWYDLNANGIQDAGEPGIGGITIHLYTPGTGGEDDVLLKSTISSPSGAYVFSGLTASASYFIEFVAPEGLTFSPQGVGSNGAVDSDADEFGITAVFIHNNSEARTDMDAGLHPPTTIGNFVWNDLNADGIQDAGEPGLGGVVVELYASDDSFVAPTTTSFNGSYSFSGIDAGDYYVQFVAPSGFTFSPQYATASNIDSDADVGTGRTAVFSVSAGTTKDDIDAGLFLSATIGDFVWSDTNGNGIQDDGEPGIPDVAVTLFKEDDTLIGNTTTDVNGVYTFTNLIPNTYYLQFTQPSGYLTSPQNQGSSDAVDSDIDPETGKTANFSVAFGQLQNDMDAGYFLPGSIGDFIWNDLNGDGVQDDGEPGISGVTVDLIADLNGNGEKDDGEPVVATDTTDGSGAYTFTDLAPGNYIVEVTDTGAVLTNYALTGGTNPLAVTITAGQDDTSADFGYQQQNASIGDFIWNDLDGDGVQDGGEPGIGGVTVDLIADLNGNGEKDDGEPVLATDTTDGSGAYDFTGLTAGNYIVEVTDTGAVLTTYVLTGGTNPLAVTITAGQDYNNADFGYQQQNASIGDFIWNDLNGDGNQDGGEPGIGGVTVDLIADLNGNGIKDAGEPVLATDTTDGNGAYDFTGLAAGNYIVEVTDTGAVLTNYALTGGTNPLAVTIIAGQDYNSADFGYQQQNASIGDFIWNDLNGDGVQDDGEPGIGGVTVDLIADLNGNGAKDDGEPVLDTDTTDGSGAYTFTDLAPGNYIVEVTDTGAVLTNYNLTGGTNPLAVILTAGEDYNSADFGYQDSATASIGDFIWNDLDGDGVQDGGEPGIGGVTVDLIADLNGNGEKDDGEPVLATDTTDGNGAYDFTGLTAGNYIVEVTDTGAVLTTYVLTGGTNPSAVTITAGQDYNSADFGYQQQNASIGDFIWNDLNGDGVQDGSEPGIGGVTVDLIADLNGNGLKDIGEPVLATDTTDGNGVYDFTGLAAGNYIVEVTDTDGVLANYALTGGANPLAVTITAGQDYNGADFGYQQQNASIGDFIWNDLNGDGVQDDGEPGIGGVTVDLIADLNGNGAKDDGEPVLATVTTDDRGLYDFTGLAAGDYLIEVTDTGAALSGFTLTSGVTPLAVTITAGQDYNNADFGYQDSATASIGDFIWNDLNGNGIQDGGEPGIGGVTVDLIADLNGNGLKDVGEPVLATDTTDSNGAYDFPGLTGGKYIVEVTDTGNVLAGLLLTGGVNSLGVSIAAGEDYNDADFGFKDPLTATISATVWNDRDGDGIQENGEPGLDGIVLNLTGAGLDDTFGTGDDVVYSPGITSNGGVFEFAGLPAGLYRVDVDDSSLPGGLALTGGTDPLVVTLAVGQTYDGADFGYQGNASIGDYVWHDADSDGNQDADESGIPGVTVYLDLNANNVRDANEPFAVTNGSGNYTIEGLYAFTYLVKVDMSTVPANYFLGTTMISSVPLSAGEIFTGADFGFVESFTVFIPLVMNNYVSAPDLVVTNVQASSALIEVVIENQGTQATSSGFWVDFYIDPNPAPTHENQLWFDLADEGIVWGVNVTIQPGESLTLRYSTAPGAPNLYYSAINSRYGGSLPAGTLVYAQVDSAHLSTNFGGVLETHEILGGPYNNVSGPYTAVATIPTTAVTTETGMNQINVQPLNLPLRQELN